MYHSMSIDENMKKQQTYRLMFAPVGINQPHVQFICEGLVC